MSKLTTALKNFGKKCNTGGTAPAGNTVAQIIENIASSFNISGTSGASVTAIELELTDGVVSGGTATLSDSTTIAITVTQSEG